MRVVLAVLAAGSLGTLLLAERTGRQDAPPARVAAEGTAAPAGTAFPAATRAPAVAPPRARRQRRQRVGDAPLPVRVRGGVLSPDGSQVALAEEAGVRFYDVHRRRLSEAIAVGGPPAGHLTWISNARVALFTGIGRGGTDLVEIEAGRVVARRHVDAEPVATARGPRGLVAVLAPPGRIGRATLLYRDRETPLFGIRAGFERVGEQAANVQPGLAVDPEAGVAYVVDAEADRIATMDLEKETGSYGSLGPVASASKLVDGRVRQAAWLGGGRLAISGSRNLPDGTIESYGLRIVDVTKPQRPQVMVSRRQSVMAAGAGRVVAFDLKGGGIAIHDRRGRRLHRLFGGVQVPHVDVLGPHAYVLTFRPGGRRGPTKVVDVRSGRVLGRRATASASSAARSRILGIDYPNSSRGRGRISYFDPLSLRPVGRSAPVHGYVWGWDQSPTGSAVALGVSNRGRIQIVATRPVAFSRIIRTGRRESIREIAWGERDRLVALTGFAGTQVLDVDLAAGKVDARRTLGGRDMNVVHLRDGLLALVAPVSGVGEARLAVIRPGQALRFVALPGVQAGFPERAGHDVRPDAPPDVMPGLAVDPQAEVAYVAPVGAPSIVRVDLASGAATTHAIAARVSKGGPQQLRMLRWVGAGRLVLSGYDADHRAVPHPIGVRLIDTADWSGRILDPAASHVDASEAGIVIPHFHRRAGKPRRVEIYDATGRRRAAFRPRHGLSSAMTVDGRVYVANGARSGRDHRTYVLDAGTGRRLRTLPFTSLPHLLSRP